MKLAHLVRATFIAIALSLCWSVLATAEIQTVTYQCPIDPAFGGFGLSAYMGRCQAPLGILTPGEARAVSFELPNPDCFPSGTKGFRVSDGNTADSRAPAGAWVAMSSGVHGLVSLYVKNDSAQTIADAYVGLFWQCGY